MNTSMSMSSILLERKRVMGKPTGQMQEDTQELLDFYNSHYNWEYNDMCRFIDNHTEEEFQEHYQTYHQLCDDYGTELVDNFGLHFDLEASYYEKFEDMYEGEYGHSTDLQIIGVMK